MSAQNLKTKGIKPFLDNFPYILYTYSVRKDTQLSMGQAFEAWKKSLIVYADPRVLSIAFLGYASGIPLFLTASTLALWLKKSGVGNAHIGVLSLCSIPYALKFLWSPFIDRMRLPFLTKWLGRRRSWLFLSQGLLIIAITALSLTTPAQSMMLTGILAITISFLSATQDTVMLAYQVERLGRNQYGPAEAMSVFGYRMGMLTSGAGALYLTDYMTWNHVYQVMAVLLGIGIITTLTIEEPQLIKSPEMELKEKKAREYLEKNPRLSGFQARVLSWCYGAIICPFTDFIARPTWLVALGIMFFYKLGDNLIGSMTNIFYTDLGYSMCDIANASKVFGMANSILGGFIGGLLFTRLGVVKSLYYCLIIHGLSILLYVWVGQVGYNLPVLYTTIAIEHITSGMRTTCLFAFQMTLVNPVYAATQLALLTSCVHLGRSIMASFSGVLVDALGWTTFFTFCSASTILSLLFVLMLAKIEKVKIYASTRKWQPTSQES